MDSRLQSPDLRNIHGIEVTLVIGLPGLGVTDITVVGSAMVGAVLEYSATQGSGAGDDRSNCGSTVVVRMFFRELRKDDGPD